MASRRDQGKPADPEEHGERDHEQEHRRGSGGVGRAILDLTEDEHARDLALERDVAGEEVMLTASFRISSTGMATALWMASTLSAAVRGLFGHEQLQRVERHGHVAA